MPHLLTRPYYQFKIFVLKFCARKKKLNILNSNEVSSTVKDLYLPRLKEQLETESLLFNLLKRDKRDKIPEISHQDKVTIRRINHVSL